MTSLLDKSHLHSAFSGDQWGSEGPAAWRARVVLFIGVALMAGGLAGSLVRFEASFTSCDEHACMIGANGLTFCRLF